MVPWWRICLPMQGTWIQSLVWEDSTCSGATKPVCCNYWSSCALEPVPCNKRSIQWEAQPPPNRQLKKACAQQGRSSTDKNKQILKKKVGGTLTIENNLVVSQKVKHSTSLVLQWLRIRLQMQGTWVWPLDSTCHRANKPVCYNPWALEPLSPNYWAHMLQPVKPTLCSATREATKLRSPHNETSTALVHHN